jgi:hypothetical protein
MNNLQRVGLCLMILLVALSVACSGSQADKPMPRLMGDVFTMGMGQTAVIENEDLSINFDSVLDDSRCPTTVNCAWTGEAKGVITVKQGENEPIDLEFNTNPAPDLNQQSFTVGEYVLELQSLDPYPQDPDKAIEDEEYRVTLSVTKP